MQNHIYWSKNGTSLATAIALDSNTPVSLATLNKGEKMYLKGENTNYASTGTFVKPAPMTSWSSGANGIPSCWTVLNV